MSATSYAYRVLRLSRDVNAIRRGPNAIAKRIVRKTAHKTTARLLRKVLGS